MRVRALVFSGDQLLLGQNADKEYSLPGGKVNPNENPIDALYREIAEETAIGELHNIQHLFNYCDNVVYRAEVLASPRTVSPAEDPDHEYLTLVWHKIDALPLKLSEFTADIISLYLNRKVEASATRTLEREGFEITEKNHKIEIRSNNHPDLARFEGEIDPLQKTATVFDISFTDLAHARPWLEWFEQQAAEMGCLRAKSTVGGEELHHWQECGYQVQCNGPMEDYTVYKTLFKAESLARLDVYVNDEKVLSLADDEVFQTLPGLAQRQAAGDKVRFVKVEEPAKI